MYDNTAMTFSHYSPTCLEAVQKHYILYNLTFLHSSSLTDTHMQYTDNLSPRQYHSRKSNAYETISMSHAMFMSH